MSMGTTMMQQAELQRQDGAKDRPSSISKRKVAVTGAASMLPGSQALSACEIKQIIGAARDVNFNVARLPEKSHDRHVHSLCEVGDENHDQLLVQYSSTFKRYSIDVTYPIDESNPYDSLDRFRRDLCGKQECPLVQAVRLPTVDEIHVALKIIKWKVDKVQRDRLMPMNSNIVNSSAPASSCSSSFLFNSATAE